jgi:hypothetical protein
LTEVAEEFESRIVSAPQAKRTPADLLEERSAFARYISRQSGYVPEIGDLMRHAERFGTDQVVETAVELGYSLDACVRLMDHCDRLDMAEFKKEHPFAKPPKVKSSEDRCKALMGITDEKSDE